MFCKNCHRDVRDTDKYCGYCGCELIKPTPSFNSEEIKKADLFSFSLEQMIPQTDPMTISESNDADVARKPIFKATILAMIIVVISCVAIFVSSNNLFYSKEGKRTVMIYMIGSDLESKHLAATKDIDEIIGSSFDEGDVNVLLYTGGAKKWHNDEIPNDKHGLFEVTNDGLKKIAEYDSNTMLEEENLSFLLNFGYENFDTEYYDLILWDHGAGPIYGYGYDEYKKTDSMSISQIKKALNDSPFIGENKLELLGFDACLMSSVEIASTLSSYADYMVASQEFEPASGWNYQFLEEVDSDTTSLEFGKLIVDYFDNYYSSKEDVKGISLSLLKLNKIDKVVKYTEDLFSKMDSDLDINYSNISRTRSNSKSYGRVANEDYHYDLVDLSDLLNKMPTKYEQEVYNLKTALSDLVVYQKTDLVNTNGVSIFFPYENQKEINNNLKKYEELDFSKSYFNFIKDFSKELVTGKKSNWDLSQTEVVSYGEGNVSITLTEDIIKNYSKADYIIFEKTSDGLFIPVFNGSDVSINGNVMSTSVSRKTLIATDTDGNKMYLTALESINGNDYVSYYIPATISRFDPDTLKIDVLGVYLDFVVDSDHPNGYISNVYPIDLNENLTYSKVNIDLEEWDDLNLLSYKYNILDAEGNYTTNWQNNKEVKILKVAPTDDYKIEFSDLDITRDYYCLFRIKDSQNNTYLSNLVKINKK